MDYPHTFHCQDYFVIRGIRTGLGVSDDPMFLWISSKSCPLNLLLVRSHQAKIIIVKRLIQGHKNVTRVRVEPKSFDQGRRKNDAFTHSATLPPNVYIFEAFRLTLVKKNRQNGERRKMSGYELIFLLQCFRKNICFLKNLYSV